jgi:hypothetical protein
MDIEIRVSGIPCIARVTGYTPEIKTDFWCRIEHAEPPSDAEIDWELCDRRGRPAPWLERKFSALPQRQKDLLEQEVLDKYEAASEPLF